MHVHQPTPREIEQLLTDQGDARVSIYLSTSPVTDRTEPERIAYKEAVSTAITELNEMGVERRRVEEFDELLTELDDHHEYWDHQARTLAVFTDGRSIRTFHLANELTPQVKVSQRYFVKPLLRSVTFPQACFVLALAEGSVRLLELGPDYGPIEVDVPGLPGSAADATHPHKVIDHAQRGGDSGAEGKTRIRQYARAVDHAIRPVVRGNDLPLLLAATEPTASIFREVNTSPELAAVGIDGSPERIDGQEMAEQAREVLDRVYGQDLAALAELFSLREGQGRVLTDVAELQRTARSTRWWSTSTRSCGAPSTTTAQSGSPIPARTAPTTSSTTSSGWCSLRTVVCWLSAPRTSTVVAPPLPCCATAGSVRPERASVLRSAATAAAVRGRHATRTR